MLIDYRFGIYRTTVIDNQPAGFICTNTLAGGGQLRMLSGYDGTQDNIIESTGGQGLIISSSNTILLQATQITINSPCDFSVNAPTTTIAPTQNTDLTNKLYVDDRVGGLSSGTFSSNQALGNVATPQSLNPISFLPSPPITPANYLKAGQSYQLVMSGSAQFSNGNDFTITLEASNGGAPVILGTVQIVVPNVTGAQTWELEADFTIRSVVANIANIFCSFDFTYNDGQSFIGKRALTSTNSLNSTLSQTLTTNVTFTTGTAGDNITTELYILKKVVDV